MRCKANKSSTSLPITSINKFLILIAGPTGVGKSSLASHLAKLYGAEIFSADSRQIYKEMNIGTAKPSFEELSSIKHHFIDEISISAKYSVGHFESDATNRLNCYFKSKNIGIMAGGTGLYLKAIMEGLDHFPEVDPMVSDELNQIFYSKGIEFLRSELNKYDPVYFRVCDINNHRRLIRALSVIRTSGQTYSSYLDKKQHAVKDYHMIPILLELPRAELYEKINKRVDEMINSGLVDEAKKLHAFRGFQALETVGYQELFDYFEGMYQYEFALEQIKQNSRRYAKRQITWFKKYGDWNSFHPENLKSIIALMEEKMM